VLLPHFAAATVESVELGGDLRRVRVIADIRRFKYVSLRCAGPGADHINEYHVAT
jgi:hypothetical protein